MRRAQQRSMRWIFGRSCLVALLLVGACSLPSPEPTRVRGTQPQPLLSILSPPELHSLGRLVLTAPFRKPGPIAQVEVQPYITDPSRGWWYENYLLVVTDGAGRIITHPFYAAYGYFSLSVPFRLFGKTESHIVLTRQIGKGTGINTAVLEVFRVADGKLVKVYERLIADVVKIYPTQQWEYRVSFAPIPDPNESWPDLDRGIEMRLQAEYVSDMDYYPKDAEGNVLPRVICVASVDGQIVERLGQTCYTAFWRPPETQ